MGIFRRGYRQFQNNPSSLRYATTALILLTVMVVLLGAMTMWIFDHSQYPSFTGALWFTLQTITTVGYGDVTPTSFVGRSLASLIMLFGIGLVTVVTARVTSTFIEAARIRARQAEATAAIGKVDPVAHLGETLATLAERLDEIDQTLSERLDRIEATLEKAAPGDGEPIDPL